MDYDTHLYRQTSKDGITITYPAQNFPALGEPCRVILSGISLSSTAVYTLEVQADEPGRDIRVTYYARFGPTREFCVAIPPPLEPADTDFRRTVVNLTLRGLSSVVSLSFNACWGRLPMSSTIFATYPYSFVWLGMRFYFSAPFELPYWTEGPGREPVKKTATIPREALYTHFSIAKRNGLLRDLGNCYHTIAWLDVYGYVHSLPVLVKSLKSKPVEAVTWQTPSRFSGSAATYTDALSDTTATVVLESVPLASAEMADAQTIGQSPWWAFAYNSMARDDVGAARIMNGLQNSQGTASQMFLSVSSISATYAPNDDTATVQITARLKLPTLQTANIYPNPA